MGEQPTLKFDTMEKRKYPRWTWRAELQGLFVDENGHRVVEQLQAMDISKRGLGAIGQRFHQIGQKFIITLPEPDGRSRYVHAKVVRCEISEDGPRLGLEFYDSPADMGNWLNSRLRMAA